MPLHREESVSAGTKSIAPVTINRLPVYVAGIPTPTIKDSIFGQDAAATVPMIGAGASMPNVSTDAIIIGTNAQVGQVAANLGAIAIGRGATSLAKSRIRLGTDLAFGAGAGDDSINIGTQSTGNGNGSISIGRGTSAATNGIAIGHTAGVIGTTEGIAIGHNANCSNTGVNHESIALGNSSSAGVNNAQTAIAIGRGATAVHALASKLIAIGEGATINTNVTQAIAIGAGATNPGSNEVVFGDPLNGNHIRLFTLRALAANPVRHRVGPSGGWAVRDGGDANDIFLVDSSAVAGDIRLLVWDVTAAALKRVTMAAAGAAPAAGFRALQVPV